MTSDNSEKNLGISSLWFNDLARETSRRSDEAYLLTLAEKYQNAPELICQTNFGEPFFSEYALSERIILLYQIGSSAGILEQTETFDRNTRVTQATQEVCDRVVQWVAEKLELEIPYLNVYESFVWDYKNYQWLRDESLYQIALRAGLIEEKPLYQMSQPEREQVLDWLEENYDIHLRTAVTEPTPAISTQGDQKQIVQIWWTLIGSLSGIWLLIFLTVWLVLPPEPLKLLEPLESLGFKAFVIPEIPKVQLR